MRWTSFESNPYGQLFERKNHKGYDRVVIQLPKYEAKELLLKMFEVSERDFEIDENDPDEMHYGERILEEEHSTFSEVMGYRKNYLKLKNFRNKKEWITSHSMFGDKHYRIIQLSEIEKVR